MSNNLRLDTDVANQVLNEMKEYNQDKDSVFKDKVVKRIDQTDDNWVADGVKEFSNIWRHLRFIESHQVNALETLIQKLQKEIDQWEETARQLGR